MTEIRHADTGPAAFPPGRMTETSSAHCMSGYGGRCPGGRTTGAGR